MGSSINDMRNHAYMESFKTDSLDTCVKLFKAMGRELPDEGKDYVLKILGEMADKFDIIKNYDLDAYNFTVDGSEEKTAFVKVSDVEEVFFDFRERLTALIIQIVLFDLEIFLAKKGYDD